MDEVNRLEQQLEGAKDLVKRRDQALKLSENREFRKLILEQFCTEECARYAQLSADPALKAEERADALAMAQAAGHLRRYLSVLVTMGNTAARELPELEAEINQARAEAELVEADDNDGDDSEDQEG